MWSEPATRILNVRYAPEAGDRQSSDRARHSRIDQQRAHPDVNIFGARSSDNASGYFNTRVLTGAFGAGASSAMVKPSLITSSWRRNL